MATNLEKEIDRLKRQSETIQLRRSLARGEVPGQSEPQAERERGLREQQTNDRSTHIHLDAGRVQTIKARPSHLAPDNMSYEDLEELQVIHFFNRLETTQGAAGGHRG